MLIERRHFREARAVIHMTDTEKRSFTLRFLAQRNVVIPSPVDSALFTVPSQRRTWFGGRPLITFIGRLTRKKRLDLLIEAFVASAPEYPTARLVIAGPDEEGIGRRIMARAKDAGLEGRVALIGVVEGHQKRELLGRSSVFVLPSEDESFGIAAAEALAVGLPVVVSKNVAISTDIAGGDAGIVVERAVAPLARAIERILGDSSYAQSLADAGRRLAESNFAIPRVSRQIDNLYRQVLSGEGDYSEAERLG
jgi:glycosyltransferase involved in cell wall biosynthesis